MTFEVRWRLTALNELAQVWLNADSTLRQRITDATNKIDQRLRLRANREGESRSGGRRVLFEPPLGINFTIDAHRPVAYVLQVWAYGKRK